MFAISNGHIGARALQADRAQDERYKSLLTLGCIAAVVATVFSVAAHLEQSASTRDGFADSITWHQDVGAIAGVDRDDVRASADLAGPSTQEDGLRASQPLATLGRTSGMSADTLTAATSKASSDAMLGVANPPLAAVMPNSDVSGRLSAGVIRRAPRHVEPNAAPLADAAARVPTLGVPALSVPTINVTTLSVPAPTLSNAPAATANDSAQTTAIAVAPLESPASASVADATATAQASTAQAAVDGADTSTSARSIGEADAGVSASANTGAGAVAGTDAAAGRASSIIAANTLAVPASVAPVPPVTHATTAPTSTPPVPSAPSAPLDPQAELAGIIAVRPNEAPTQTVVAPTMTATLVLPKPDRAALVTPPSNEQGYVTPHAATNLVTLHRAHEVAASSDMDPAVLMKTGKQLAGQTVSFVVGGEVNLNANSQSSNHLSIANYSALDPHMNRGLLEKWLSLDRDVADETPVRITGVVRDDQGGERVEIDVTDIAALDTTRTP